MYREMERTARGKRTVRTNTSIERSLDCRLSASLCTYGLEWWKDRNCMSSQELLNLIASLSPEQQAAVEKFVRILKEEAQPAMAFRSALDEFVRKHPELLRLLAQ
jgi:hypothetical protein